RDERLVRDRDPYAGTHRQPTPLGTHRVAQTVVDPAGDVEDHARGVRVLDDDDELVAAQPGHRSPARGRRPQDPGDVHQDVVPGGVAVAVVDLLELVQVDHQDGH